MREVNTEQITDLLARLNGAIGSFVMCQAGAETLDDLPCLGPTLELVEELTEALGLDELTVLTRMTEIRDAGRQARCHLWN